MTRSGRSSTAVAPAAKSPSANSAAWSADGAGMLRTSQRASDMLTAERLPHLVPESARLALACARWFVFDLGEFAQNRFLLRVQLCRRPDHHPHDHVPAARTL